MAVTVTVIENGVKTSESDAAYDLKYLIDNSIGQQADGNILIFTNLTLHNQTPRDLDILVAGSLSNYKIPVTKDGVSKQYYINDFCIAVELKEHPYVEPKGTDLWVSYSDGKKKNATAQNEGQKYAFLKYFRKKYDYDPRIANFVWLKSISREQLVKFNNGSNPVGALPSEFSFKEMMELLASQQDTSNFSGTTKNVRFFADIKQLLAQARPVPQGLTVKRLNTIVQNKIQQSLENVKVGGDNITVFSGRAGTGKTFFLLQTALKLSSSPDHPRCLILSYNHALVSDIRRLLHFLDKPDGYDEEYLDINTMYKFFNELIGIIDKNMCFMMSDTNEDRARKLKDFKELLDSCSEEDLSFVRQEWNYILVDEAQDWTNDEIEILIKLYGKEHIIAADGIDQFIKNVSKQKFGGTKSNVKLSTSLRQKTNLIKFLDAYVEQAQIPEWKIKPNNNLLGGEVIVTNQYSDTFHKQIMEECRELGCCNYDILFLVPNSFVEKDEHNNRFFRGKESFKKAGINVFDGTNSKNREDYSVDTSECRLYTYESCRGLEAMTTICLNFDELIEDKMKYYVDVPSKNEICSLEERRRNYVYLWTLMPLTRAINKIVIVLKNTNSEVGRILRNVSSRYDCVKWQCND